MAKGDNKWKEMVDKIAEAINTPRQYGLHIVIDDGNIEKHNIKWCLDNLDEYCPEEHRKLANEIGEYFLGLENDNQRWALHMAAMEKHWNRNREED